MSLKNASVILTYKVEGALVTPGSYEYRERTTSGSILPEDQRLFISRKSENSNCFIRTHLNETFVNWAISEEGRPSRKDPGLKSFKAYTFWKRWTEMQRLNYHVARYASDLGGVNYEFVVNEE